MRITLAVAAACLAFIGVSTAQDADAAIRRTTDIPAQALAPALQALIKERDIQLVYRAELIADRKTAGASGKLTAVEALDQLLSGTGLTYKYLDERTLTILPLQPAGARGGAATWDRTNNEADQSALDQSQEIGARPDGARWIRLAQGAQKSAAANAAEAAKGENNQSGAESVQEIIVTAQKREERLREVPIPVAVISGDSLVQLGQVSLKDYYSKVPGLSIGANYGDAAILTIRGITTGDRNGNPTVGTTIDDAPYASSTSVGGGNAALEVDSFDLERIEVLRGPQGTLYGANSIGGLMKFVTSDPSLAGFSGRVGMGIQTAKNDSAPGYNMRGFVNVPVGETFAVRLSAFSHHDPGYIEDGAHDVPAINDSDAYGARVAALWQPSDDFSFKLNAIRQHKKSGGPDIVAPTSVEDMRTFEYYPKVVGSNRTVSFIEGVMRANVGQFALTSISSYVRSDAHLRAHNSVIDAIYGLPGTVVSFDGSRLYSKFSQELRMDVSLSERIDWMLGGFYTSEDGTFNDLFTSSDPVSGSPLAPAGDRIRNFYPSSFREVAAFSNITLKLTDRFDVQLGGRKNFVHAANANDLIFFSGTPIVAPKTSTDDSSFTYLLTPRFKFSSDLMMYARIASGYRPGGPNFNVSAGAPSKYQADKTRNYELGVKGELADRRLSIDGSVYRIDWNDIQILDALTFPGFPFVANPGRAKSQGIELSVEAHLAKGLTLSAWGVRNEATIEEIAVAGVLPGARPGDRLPYTARYSGYVAVDYEFPLPASLTGMVSVSGNYIGSRLSEFAPSRLTLPSYTQVELNFGIESSGGWNVNAFITNLTDERGLVSLSALNPELTIIKPRAAGVNISRSF